MAITNIEEFERMLEKEYDSVELSSWEMSDEELAENHRAVDRMKQEMNLTEKDAEKLEQIMKGYGLMSEDALKKQKEQFDKDLAENPHLLDRVKLVEAFRNRSKKK